MSPANRFETKLLEPHVIGLATWHPRSAASEKKGQGKKVFLQYETEPHREQWRILASSTANSFRADKIRFFKSVCEDAAAASRLNNTRKVYKIIRTISGKSQKIMPHW